MGCLGRIIRDDSRRDPAPEPGLLIAARFGEFVRVVGSTNVPVGVELLSVITSSSPEGFGNGESYRRSAIFVSELGLSFSKS